MLLPDIIDLEQKQLFERNTVPALERAFADGSFDSLTELLDWLREEVSAMTPGSDPLPALKAPLAYLCGLWRAEMSSEPLLQDLQRWSGQ